MFIVVTAGAQYLDRIGATIMGPWTPDVPGVVLSWPAGFNIPYYTFVYNILYYPIMYYSMRYYNILFIL